MERLNRSLMWVEQLLAVLILVGILGTMFAQVVARYLFRAPFSWSEELCRLALIWMTFLAAAYIMAQRKHLAVDLWSDRVRPLWRARADLFVFGLTALTCLLLCLGSLRFVWYVHPVGSPALGIAKSYWYGGVSLGLLLMAFHSLVHAWSAWSGQLTSASSHLQTDDSVRLSWSDEETDSAKAGQS
ncbi:MAG: TRAP transporter small permease [Pirellulaceae bacterium]|nr:TRAP transporter small permease [Pirellulaceae bacterium]